MSHLLFKILRRINSNFLRNGKNSFAGLEIQSVDFITSQKFRNFPVDALSLALLPKLNTRSYFLRRGSNSMENSKGRTTGQLQLYKFRG